MHLLMCMLWKHQVKKNLKSQQNKEKEKITNEAWGESNKTEVVLNVLI